MDMRHPDGVRVKNVYLPRRSLLVMEGPARYEWSHGIASRKTDMVCLFFCSASFFFSLSCSTPRWVREKEARALYLSFIHGILLRRKTSGTYHTHFGAVSGHISHKLMGEMLGAPAASSDE